MTVRLNPFSILILSGVAFALPMLSAAAEGAAFCEYGENHCVRAYLENVASVTVKSTNITEQEGADFCTSGKKTVSKNLTGGTKLTPGEEVVFYADDRCKYKVKFVTTSGCIGDKTTHISPNDFASGEKVARIEGGCGTLKTKTVHLNASFE
ncbi:MAG: hypothetical protein AAF996_13260 [Pseudomonadota bacterium]